MSIDAPHPAGAQGTSDARISAPAALRNAPHIEAELRRLAPSAGHVLEIASGTGEHAVRFARALPGVVWQPSDVDPARLASIAAWREADPPANLRPPVALDASVPGWAEGRARVDMVLVVNLLHLITGAAAQAVLTGMAEVAAPGGLVIVYGPFLRDGAATSDGDAAFHARLQQETPGAGYKDVGWVRRTLTEAGAAHREMVAMPANNLLLVHRVPS